MKENLFSPLSQFQREYNYPSCILMYTKRLVYRKSAELVNQSIVTSSGIMFRNERRTPQCHLIDICHEVLT